MGKPIIRMTGTEPVSIVEIACDAHRIAQVPSARALAGHQADFVRRIERQIGAQRGGIQPRIVVAMLEALVAQGARIDGDAERAEAATQPRRGIGHIAAGVIPASMAIDFQEAAKGSEKPFETMIKWCEQTQSKAILGSTMTKMAGVDSATCTPTSNNLIAGIN